MNRQPPKWADRLLEWFCDPYLIEDLQGDLHEVFHDKIEQGRGRLAAYLYVWLVLRSFRPSVIKKNQKFKNFIFTMTRNNFKLAIRVLWRDKLNTGINLIGLTLGVTCFLLLGLYVKQELSYDQFHGKKSRIHRSWLKEDYGEGKVFFNSHTPLRFESLLEDNLPDVERVVQYVEQTYPVGNSDQRIDEKIAIVSPDFFNVFDFNLIDGNKESPLPTLDDLAISQSYAIKYFGTSAVIGKILSVKLDTTIRQFTISSVFDDIPYESSIQFDLAISTDNNRRMFGAGTLNGWFNVIAETYVLFHENVNVNAVEKKLQDVILSQMKDVSVGQKPILRDQYVIGFQPLTNIHLNPDIPLGYAPVTNPQYVMILGTIAFLVLIMACINYTTLSAGQSLKRSKEVGMRKVLGASRGALTYQYLSESLLLAVLAMAVGTASTVLLIPTFNALTGTEIFYQFELWHISICLLIGLLIGFAAGLYPAVIISAFKTINILNGSVQSIGNLTIRKGLLILQFLVTVSLISTVLIIGQQINFLMDKDLGYDYNAVVAAELPIDHASQGVQAVVMSGMENGNLLKARLEQYPKINKLAMGTHVFGSNGWVNLGFTDNQGAFKWFRLLAVDHNYLSAFNINIKEGRGFEEGNGLDKRQSVLLNETAVKYFDLKKPVGSQLPGKRFGDHQIIGVVNDFNFSSLHTTVEPLVIVQNIEPIVQGISDVESSDSIDPKIVFTYTGSNLHDAIEILQKEWEVTFTNEELNYQFINERIKAQYDNETRLSKLITTATFLSVAIATLGLFGLIMLVANSKVKEIGIRKVMGASSGTIFKLLVKGFVFQLFIAIIISVPLTIYFMDQWLGNFAYRVGIGFTPFLLSSIVTIFTSGLVICYHTLRASKTDPIKSLRSE